MNQFLKSEEYPSLVERSKPLDFYSIRKSKLEEIIDKVYDLCSLEATDKREIGCRLSNEHGSYWTPRKHEVKDFLNSSRKLTLFDLSFKAYEEKNILVKQIRVNIIFNVLKNPLVANFISVSGTDPTWVEGTRTTFSQMLEDQKNHNRFFYSNYFFLLVQISFVMWTLFLSFLSASKLKSYVRIDNSETYIFFIALIFLSNIWTYLSDTFFGILRRYRPVTEIVLTDTRVRWNIIAWGIIASFIGSALWFFFTTIVSLLK